MNLSKNSKLLIIAFFSFFLIFETTNSTVLAVGSSWHMVNINSSGEVGDAHILINGDVVTMIDAGQYESAKNSLLPYLEKIGINTINHFFVSHPHNDHYKGLDALVEGGVHINHIYFNMPPDGVYDFAYSPREFNETLEIAQSKGAQLHNISKGYRIALPNNSEIKILYAQKERQLEGVNVSVNDYSLIMRWDTEGFRVLFAGDLNSLLGGYLSRYDYFKADILKVPHHGATGVAPDAFFDIVNPKLNMFPTPRDLWLYSPRMDQVKSWTLNKKILHCVTGSNGNIELSFKESAISLLPETSTQNCPTGGLNISPGEKINEPIVMPQIQLLLNSR